VEEAFAIERRLMGGRRLEDTGAALGLSVWIEDGLRSILRDSAVGELGTDLSATADESLISAGLAAGEGSAEQMGTTSEWDAIPDPWEMAVEEELAQEERKAGDITMTDHREPHPGLDPETEPETDPAAAESETSTRAELDSADWLSEVSRLERDTLEFPVRVTRRDDDETVDIDLPRVRHLFPVPDETEWDVSELEYDRTRSSNKR
jgi:hypothetical protein